mgnify:CR=1 FL=1
MSVPLTILTGFLGAGKTTLLNHILTGDHGLKVGILVNDFGSINVDAELVVDVDDGLIALANGCVCCQIRDDLVESVAELIDRDDPVEYVILEASGVADPASIYMTFVDSSYRDRIRLDSVTCVVDADQVLNDEDPDLIKLKLQQIGVVVAENLVGVDDAGDTIEPDPVAIGRVDKCHVDARRVGDAARLEDDVLDRIVSIDQLRNRVHQVVTDLAADTAVGQTDHAVLHVDHEISIHVDRPEVVHEDPDPQPVIPGEDVVEQRRLARAQKPGQDRQRN